MKVNETRTKYRVQLYIGPHSRPWLDRIFKTEDEANRFQMMRPPYRRKQWKITETLTEDKTYENR